MKRTGVMLEQQPASTRRSFPIPGFRPRWTLSGGRISVIIECLAAFASAFQGATVKLLAVADKRLPEFPDLAAVAKDPAGT
jgi:hypothetical protein